MSQKAIFIKFYHSDFCFHSHKDDNNKWVVKPAKAELANEDPVVYVKSGVSPLPDPTVSLICFFQRLTGFATHTSCRILSFQVTYIYFSNF